MPEITITRAGATITATDGVRTRAWTTGRISVAKGTETRLLNDQEYATKWLASAPDPIHMAPPPRKPAPNKASIQTRRIGAIITGYIDGRAVRSWECRSIQGAVDLESKLTSDPGFAAKWVGDGAPTSPEATPHPMERRSFSAPATETT